MAICRMLVNALQRWRDMDAISSRRRHDTPTGRRLLVAAQYSLFPEKPLRCGGVFTHWTTKYVGKKAAKSTPQKKLKSFRTSISQIDQVTMKREEYFVNIPKGTRLRAAGPRPRRDQQR